MNKSELYNKINNQILNKLNEGIIPWKKSWKVGLPANLISKRNYRGINFLSLSLKDFASPYYLTFYQCKQRGGSIISGEKSSMIIYYKLIDLEAENDSRAIPFIRYSNVFNLTQTDLDTTDIESQKLISCEHIIQNLKDTPTIKNNISRSYYTPREDYISLPRITDFNSSEEYYSTLFHELIHWTGHGSRVGRPSLVEFEEVSYSYEELVAEIGSSYLCALSGISSNVVDNQTAYIQGYLKLSKEKEPVFPQAAKDAQKAIAFILGDLEI